MFTNFGKLFTNSFHQNRFGDHVTLINLCAICAGMFDDTEGGKDNPLLKFVYATVLPICDTCKSRGGKALVGRHIKHNGHAIQERLD